MAGKIKGITIEFDGDVSKLQKSLKEVDKASGQAYRTLKDINKALKFNPGNTELIAQKQRQLQKQLEASKTKLKALRDADSEMKKQLEAGNLGQDKYDELQREIIKTESKVKHFQGEIDKLNPSNVEKIASSFDKVGKKLQGVGKKISSLGKELSTKLTLPLAAIGTISFNNAADLEDALGATEQIYGKAAKEMEKWADNLQSYYGIAEGKALEYSNTMGAMLKNIGGKSDEEAAKMSQTLVELAGDLSAMFGGSTEEAVNALTGALKGNNSMLDNYGMGVNEATIKTKALEMGLYDGKGAMDLQTKQAATLALIMEQTADAQGQAAREAEGASGSMKSLKTEITNLATDIGQVLLPIITPLIQKISDWVAKFKELSPETQSMIVKIGLIAAAVGPLLLVLGSLITTIGSVSTALGSLMTFVSANPIVLIAAGVAVAVGLIIANWDKIKAETTEVWNSVYNTIANKIEAAKNKVKSVIDAIRGFFNFRFTWPKIPMPHFGISPSGWKIGDLLKGSIPKLGIEWYAQGGIFDNPSLIGVGEAGSEAVVPTHKLDKFLADGVSRVLSGLNLDGTNSGNTNNFNISNLVVREEADIKKIAKELFEMQNRKSRSMGVI